VGTTGPTPTCPPAARWCPTHARPPRSSTATRRHTDPPGPTNRWCRRGESAQPHRWRGGPDQGRSVGECRSGRTGSSPLHRGDRVAGRPIITLQRTLQQPAPIRGGIRMLAENLGRLARDRRGSPPNAAHGPRCGPSRLGNAQPAPATTLAMPRPRCAPQTSSIKITKTTPSGISHVHGYGSRRRDCCDIRLPPTTKRANKHPSGH
jgi:hypothetical protein